MRIFTEQAPMKKKIVQVGFSNIKVALRIMVQIVFFRHSFYVTSFRWRCRKSWQEEAKPGQDVAVQLSRLEAGHVNLLRAIQQIQTKQQETEDALSSMSVKNTRVGQKMVAFSKIRIDVQALKESNEANISIIKELQQTEDGLENRSRRNNLLFFGLPEPFWRNLGGFKI